MPCEFSSETRREWMAGLGINVKFETEEELLARFPTSAKIAHLLRTPNATPELRAASNHAGIRVAGGPVVWDARLELPVWYREQAVTETLHRYGNIVVKPSALGKGK